MVIQSPEVKKDEGNLNVPNLTGSTRLQLNDLKNEANSRGKIFSKDQEKILQDFIDTNLDLQLTIEQR